jgi:hypothetical protein
MMLHPTDSRGPHLRNLWLVLRNFFWFWGTRGSPSFWGKRKKAPSECLRLFETGRELLNHD